MKLLILTAGVLLYQGIALGQSNTRNAEAITPESRTQQPLRVGSPLEAAPVQSMRDGRSEPLNRQPGTALYQPLRTDRAEASNATGKDRTLYLQDFALRDPRYINANDPGRAASRNAYVNPGSGLVLARYNHSFRRYFYYCAQAGTTGNLLYATAAPTHDLTAINIKQKLRADAGCSAMCCCGSINYAAMLITGLVPLCPAHLRRDLQLLPDNTARHSNSASYFSFDGYVVYGQDTLQGVVTIAANEVSLEYRNIRNDRRSTSYDLRDNNLHAITLYKGPRELNLVRLYPDDKHLSRLVHRGRMNIYDRSYSFLTTDNIARHLTVISGDETIQVKNTSELAALVSETYQLKDANKMRRERLIATLNRLD